MTTVLVTGASRGIGLELVTQSLQAGNDVIATYRGEAPSLALQQLEKKYPQLELQVLDVNNEGSIASLSQRLQDRTIDILINNAGIMGVNAQSLTNMDTTAWLETFAVNSIAPFTVSCALLPNLKLSTSPRIITISSQMGSLQHKGVGRYAYRTSKAAVNKTMQIMAQDLAEDNICVCMLHPGWVQTDMGGEQADITSQESAQGILNFVHGLTMEQTGQFFTWKGDIHPW